MTKLFCKVVLGFSMAAFAPLAYAACPSNTCTPAGSSTEYCCDQICTGGTCPYSHTMTACDTAGTSTNPSPDGVCVLCITGSNATLNGGSINETICGSDNDDVIDGRGGNDIIQGKGGDDQLTGGSGDDNILGGPGTDVLIGSGGNDILVDDDGNTYADGGTGDDAIVTVDGDDEIYGGDDNDDLYNGGGADWVEGGAGADLLQTLTFSYLFASQDIGATYCGGTGNDEINVYGGAHACVDGGTGTDECNWTYNVNATQTAFDVGTAIACETTTGMSATRTPKCGCP